MRSYLYALWLLRYCLGALCGGVLLCVVLFVCGIVCLFFDRVVAGTRLFGWLFLLCVFRWLFVMLSG